MKKYLVIIFSIHSIQGFSQNLVHNPSFEDTIYCPSGMGYIYILQIIGFSLALIMEM